MKRKEIDALHQKNIDELKTLLAGKVFDLAKARLEKKVAKLKNISLVKSFADQIARLKTIIKEKELLAKLDQVKEEKPKKLVKSSKKVSKKVKK